MTIRRRLASYTLAMVGLLVLMGGMLQLAGPVIVGAFRNSLDSMNALNAIRELKFNINRQKTALNRYLLLDDGQELLSFEEASELANKNLKTIEDQFKGGLPKEYAELDEHFVEANSAASKIVLHYKEGRKAEAHGQWLSDLFPKFQKLEEYVNGLEEDKSKHAQGTFLKIRDLSKHVGEVVLILFIVALLTGIILFRSLYRAVMKPLEELKAGVNEFGKGYLDRRINLTHDNEFGALADAFNKMAENIHQLQMQAVHMDRMSAVGQLAGGVAHEINNPLTAVLGQAQILLAKTKEEDPAHNNLKKIENAAIRCRKIVRGLLDFSRPSQTKFEPIDVNNMILSTLDLCEADLKKGRINVMKNLGTKLPRIKGNTSELQQVLLNLINNAIQAMPGGGSLALETRTYNQKLTLLDRRKGMPSRVVEGQWVEIRVKDTGAGISQDHIARIFDPFFTTKDIGKGTGLGLSISTGIVQKHGGDLSVESGGLNKGSTFVLKLFTKGPAGTNMKNPSQGMAA